MIPDVKIDFRGPYGAGLPLKARYFRKHLKPVAKALQSQILVGR